MDRNIRVVISWSNLPTELLEKIAKYLDTETDILRLRAVCSSWRSVTTPFKKSPCVNIKLPCPLMSRKPNGDYFTLVERTLYRLELPPSPRDTKLQPNFWMLKLQRLSNGTMRVIKPSRHRVGTVNTLDFRVFEVRKSYALDHANPDEVLDFDEYKRTKKIVFSKHDGDGDDDYCVMAIDGRRKMWYIKSGNDRWKMVPRNGGSNKYDGIVNLKGRFYGVDDWGCIWEFNSMFKSKRFLIDIIV